VASPQKTVDKRLTPAFRAQAGKGRPKGVQNKATKAIKEMVVEALDKAGGVDYLLEQSEKNPTAFLALVSKIIPLTADLTVSHVWTEFLAAARSRALTDQAERSETVQ
jgi:hypothetical protein